MDNTLNESYISSITKDKIKIISNKIVVLLFLLVGLLLPSVPGPSVIYTPIQILSFISQMVAIYGFIITLLLSLIWIIKELSMFVFKKTKKINTKVLSIIIWTGIFFLANSIPNMLNVTDYARNYAIKNSEPIINAIENYQYVKGFYPENLEELKPDFIKEIPETGIIGIRKYYYELKNDSYELSFNQNVILFFNFEVSVYSPTDQYEPEGKIKQLYDTKFKHWKYYYFD